MVTTITKWGNSLGVRIPKTALKNAHLEEGDTVEIIPTDEGIRLLPYHAEPSLDQLVAMITPENSHAEQFSGLHGAEVWD